MIAKRIERKQHSSDYKRLAHYILDKKADGRKVREAWSTNCATPDDFDLAIKEVTATQHLDSELAAKILGVLPALAWLSQKLQKIGRDIVTNKS